MRFNAAERLAANRKIEAQKRRAAWVVGGYMALAMTLGLLLGVALIPLPGLTVESTGWAAGFAVPLSIILWVVFASIITRVRLQIPWGLLYFAILLVFLWALVGRGV